MQRARLRGRLWRALQAGLQPARRHTASPCLVLGCGLSAFAGERFFNWLHHLLAAQPARHDAPIGGEEYYMGYAGDAVEREGCFSLPKICGHVMPSCE